MKIYQVYETRYTTDDGYNYCEISYVIETFLHREKAEDYILNLKKDGLKDGHTLDIDEVDVIV